MSLFPSTILPQTNDPKEIQKGILDLLDKINRIAGEGSSGSVSGIKVVSTNYTFEPNDGVTDLFVTTGASTIVVTLARSASNPGRLVRVWKADSGTGEVRIIGRTTGSTTETISGYASVYAGLQYQHADIYQDGTTNFNVGQYIQPVAGEPSWGTPHTHKAQLINNYDPGTLSVTIDVSAEVPVGTNGIYVHGTFTAAALNAMAIRDTSGSDWIYASNKVAGGITDITGTVALDANRQFTVVYSSVNISAVYLWMNKYWR